MEIQGWILLVFGILVFFARSALKSQISELALLIGIYKENLEKKLNEIEKIVKLPYQDFSFQKAFNL